MVNRFGKQSLIAMTMVLMSAMGSASDRVIAGQPAARISGLVVTVVRRASIASDAEGIVAEVVVEEGQAISEGDVVLRLDDRKANWKRSLAEQAWKIAEKRRADSTAVEAARAELAERNQAVVEHAVAAEANRRRAGNELKLQAAEKAERVAKNEWARAVSARENFADSVSQSEIESLLLTYQQSQLETRQAQFELGLAEIEVRADEASGKSLELKKASAELAVRAAEAAAELVAIEATMRRIELDRASGEVDNLRLRAPIDGVVVRTAARIGDWVRPGQVLAEVLDLNRLRVEGYADASKLTRLKSGPKVIANIVAEVTTANGETLSRPAAGVFVSPEIDPVTGESRFWIEVDNPDGQIQPGSKASVVVSAASRG